MRIASISALALVLAAGMNVAVAQTTPALPGVKKGDGIKQNAAAPKDGERLPIKRLTLYRSGVGSFERRGVVEGNAKIQLRFNTDQINDILKSMIVLDLSKGKGSIDGVSYGSKEPLSRRLSSFGVDISDDPTLATILGRLRGSAVTVHVPEGPVSGTILGGEVRPEAQGQAVNPVMVPYLNVITENGIRSINLTQIIAVELKDKELSAELNKALTAVAEHRADRTKTVDVNLSGEGGREIVIEYVQEMPVWKTSYRLVLPDLPKTGEKAPAAIKKDTLTLQGWAIVENTTDEDWQNVTLSLVAGRPVSFRMDLYEPLYVFRPEVPVPMVAGVSPRAYEGGQSPFRDNQQVANKPADEERRYRYAGGMPPATPTAPPAPGRMEVLKSASGRTTALSGEDMAGYAARSQAAAVESGEVFAFELESPVSVERQRSAMLPIISSALEGRRVSIFNPADSAQYPMRGVELTNTTKLQLMPGPISVFDGGTYAGDAQIGHVPAGDKRLLAYAVDLDVSAQRDENWNSNVRKVRIVHGLLEVTSLRQNKVAFAFTNKDKARGRTLIVETPRLENWTLADTAKPYEQTEAIYRFEVPMEAGKEAKIAVMQEHTEAQSLALNQIDMNTLLTYQKQGQVSEKVIDAFRQAAQKQDAMAQTQRQITELEQEKAAIDADQGRIRQNMNSIDKTSQLYATYMKKLTEQETRLEAIAANVATLKAQLKKQQEEFNAFVAGLNVE